MCWPMGASGDLDARFARCFASFLDAALTLGIVWEAGQADGGAVWISSWQRDAWELDPWDQPQVLAQADDAGSRYQAFWEWVAAHEPTEPAWQLDTIAVAPELQGCGIGGALIQAGLSVARADGTCAFLSTGTAANVTIYGRCGFRVYDEADAPDRGAARLVHALGSVNTVRPVHRRPVRCPKAQPEPQFGLKPALGRSGSIYVVATPATKQQRWRARCPE